MVAQEHAPLTVGRNRGRLRQDLRDRVPRLPADAHEDARHHREVEAHVALVAAGLVVAEVVDHVGGPLVRFGQQHPAGVALVDVAPHGAQELVCLRQVLAVGALTFVQVRDRVQPEAVDAEVEPEAEGLEHRRVHSRVVEVEVGLVAVEPVPEVLSAYRVPGPVRRLGVDEDDAGVAVGLVGVGPDVEVTVRAVRVAP